MKGTMWKSYNEQQKYLRHFLQRTDGLHYFTFSWSEKIFPTHQSSPPPIHYNNNNNKLYYQIEKGKKVKLYNIIY